MAEHKTSGDSNADAPGPPRILRSEDLFVGSREIVIEHCGQHYRLRLTSTGKLILTK